MTEKETGEDFVSATLWFLVYVLECVIEYGFIFNSVFKFYWIAGYCRTNIFIFALQNYRRWMLLLAVWFRW
jgi:hypothetical protein